MDKVTAYIGLGSNLGERKNHILRAITMLAETRGVEIAGVSTLLETDPVGLQDQPRFLNCVAAVKTTLEPAELHSKCLDIESRLGRKRMRRWAPRTIDLDILLFGNKHVRQADLVIPHPEITRRPFVQAGLRELGLYG